MCGIASFSFRMSDLRTIGISLADFGSPNWWLAAAITLLFAAFGRLVRGVTTPGAIAGALVCLALISGAGWGGFASLCAVFILTWLATRIGYHRKQSLGTAERRAGRNAGQVIANLGVAAAAALLHLSFPNPRLLAALGAALAEATADTVSSEIGQAMGGIPRLVTNWRAVAPGTDGAITFLGTAAGCVGAVLIAVTCAVAHVFAWDRVVLCAAAGAAGMLVDSFLGATVERRGWLGNNGVNFLSTAAAAGLAFLLS